MNCKKCNGNLEDNTKICNNCGQAIDTTTPSTNIEKIKKNLLNTGNSVYAIGWITIILNVGIYLWSIIDKNFSETGLPASDLSGTFLMVVVASIFIILGQRIKKLIDKNIKLYLQILLGLSLTLLIWLSTSGGKVGIFFLVVIVYIVLSLVSIYKAMKIPEFTNTLINPEYKLNKKGWIIFGLVAVVLFVLAVGFDLSKQNTVIDYSDIGNTISKEDFIKQTVDEVKNNMVLPNTIDESTTLTNIIAEPAAILYQYDVVGIEASGTTAESMKEFLLPTLCVDTDIKSLLNEDVMMKFSYNDTETQKNYLIIMEKNDCIGI